MSTKLYVGHLPAEITNAELNDLFAANGKVVSAEIVNDRETGASRGFGFVEMATSDDATAAMRALNGHEINGRSLQVNEAHSKGR